MLICEEIHYVKMGFYISSRNYYRLGYRIYGSWGCSGRNSTNCFLFISCAIDYFINRHDIPKKQTKNINSN